MAKIVLSTMGSLGDLHPMIALALELKRRGHDTVINSWSGYEEKVLGLGLTFARLRPDIDPDDREIHRKAMHAVDGPEYVIRELIMGNIRPMYDDLSAAIDGADLFVSGEIVYAAAPAAEVSGVKWVSTSLAPLTMFSAHDPNVYVQTPWVEYLRPLPTVFHRGMFSVIQMITKSWRKEYRDLRQDLGLDPDHDPMFRDKFSPLLHLAMFSRALGSPQPDWPKSTVQTGACFYDESREGELEPHLAAFLDAGEPPIIFTLGSAAVFDAGDFFDESVKIAKQLGRRAILLYGRDCGEPKGLTDDIVAFDYAPYSLVFPRSACVVHQGGVGTTGQVLRAGVPHLIMPFSHDQPDNAARCRRAGVAEVISRTNYQADVVVGKLKQILDDPKYLGAAIRLKRIVEEESGTAAACDAIEDVLRN